MYDHILVAVNNLGEYLTELHQMLAGTWLWKDKLLKLAVR